MVTENGNLNYIDKLVNKDLENKTYTLIHTRFPPEPNGYLHIGSAYAINISYSIAKKHKGKFNLRFDDTNPQKEDIEYVEAIKEDMKWLGFDFEEPECYGSDYSEEIYQYAIYLIKKGKAYVCDLSSDEIRVYRGTLTTKGQNSPYRDRGIAENLTLFNNMRAGYYQEGEKVLRAKIDMSNANINLRDPVIYRLSYTPHYKTKDKWCVYPIYDFAHPIQDYIEGITHSLCSIEFKNHRPLYDWVLSELDLKAPLPRQIEFGRISVSGVVTSKRYLKILVNEGLVDSWDDPRLPTIKGLKRRGYTKESVLHFLGEIGVSRGESIVDVSMLENSIRKDLKNKVPAIMAVLDPIKVTITNLNSNYLEYLSVVNNKDNPSLGIREVPFTSVLYIEREDFSENPAKNYNRLVLGGEVRLMHAYFIKCHEAIKNESGQIIELKCTYDPETKSGSGFNGRKVKGTIHWVSTYDAIPCEARLFNSLFTEQPSEDNLYEVFNPLSQEIKKNAMIESFALNFNGQYQFIRHGFFIYDEKLSINNKLVYNRTVSLKSTYNK